MKSTYLKYMIIIGLVANLNAQAVSKVGTSAANFLKIPVDAIGTGRGEAVVTGFNDAATVFYNPATLALIQQPTAHFSYVNWYEGIQLNQAAMVFPGVAGGVAALNVVSVSSGQIEITTEINPDGTGDFYDYGAFSLGGAYGRSLTDRFMIGANAKILRETIYNSSASGFALDIGGRYVTPWPGLLLGFTISNFGTKMQMTGDDLLATVDPDPLNSGNNDIINAYYATDRFDIPLRMVIGAGWEMMNTPFLKMTLEADGVYPSDNHEWMNVGAEAVLLNGLFRLTSGYSRIFLPENDPQFSVGAGLSYRIFGGVILDVNYAYQDHKYLKYNEHVSISLRY